MEEGELERIDSLNTDIQAGLYVLSETDGQSASQLDNTDMYSNQSKLSESDFGDVPLTSSESSMLYHDDTHAHENYDHAHEDPQLNYNDGELYDTVQYPADNSYVYHRQFHHSDSLSDIDTDSEAELEEKYRQEILKRQNQVDPGPFKYNRTMCMAVIPCSILVIALAGEM